MPFHGRAFGIQLEADFKLPGVLNGNGREPGVPTHLKVVSREALDRGWHAENAARTFDADGPDGRPVITIDYDPDAGYRVWARNHGECRISPNGSEILCAPPHAKAGRWRLLIGQALPLASALRGFEVLHASAVAIDGRAAGFVGASGAGKTSLALQLVLEGAQLLADDVLALEVGDGEVLAHAGVRTANVPHDQAAAMSPDELGRLGTIVGDSDKLHVKFETSDRPLPLAAIYFLRRETGIGRPSIERIDPPDPALLLGSTYVFHVPTRERLVNQLDVCSQIAQTVGMFGVRFDPAHGVRAVSVAVRDHLNPS